MTIPELQYLRESEDKVEFKEAKNNFPYNGGSHKEQENRRKCYLGYIVALANEGGGKLIFGMDDSYPHNVVGSNFVEGKLGELEDGVYEKLEIRVRLEELFDENGLRVLVSHIPSRPIGKMLKFEGVPLMRVGDSLRNMSDEEMFAILSEQEPDFSAKIVKDFSLEDIDDEAFSVLKDSYTIKQRNPLFAQLSKTQILSDLKQRTNYKTKLIALGGITLENQYFAYENRAEGVAFLGSIWGDENPLKIFEKCIQKGHLC